MVPYISIYLYIVKRLYSPNFLVREFESLDNNFHTFLPISEKDIYKYYKVKVGGSNNICINLYIYMAPFAITQHLRAPNVVFCMLRFPLWRPNH